MLERKTGLVFTLLKASVYSMVLQQQLDMDTAAGGNGGGGGGGGSESESAGDDDHGHHHHRRHHRDEGERYA